MSNEIKGSVPIQVESVEERKILAEEMQRWLSEGQATVVQRAEARIRELRAKKAETDDAAQP